MKCKICKKKIYGRSDKLFCSIGCKNKYHSLLKIFVNKHVTDINKLLFRNREILQEVLGKNKIQKKIHRLVLEKKNFNFKYHTHYHINIKNKMYYFVYDIAWMEFSNNEILIVRK